MRSDMGKCVIERPRGNSSAPSAKARDYGKITCDEEGYDYDGMTRLPVSSKQEGYHKKLGDKSFSDVLGPLEGYLRNSCGRPWNDVFSEIARTIGRSGSYGINHILTQHLNVAIHTYRGVDNNVYSCDKHGISRVGGYHSDFHVEPETGILRASTNYRKWRSQYRADLEKKKPLDVVAIDAGREYRKIAGIWYFRKFTEVEEIVQTGKSFTGRPILEKQMKLVSEYKRQLGKKDLKQLGLRNN